MCEVTGSSRKTLSTALRATAGSAASWATARGIRTRFLKAKLLANLLVRNGKSGLVVALALCEVLEESRAYLENLDERYPAIEVLLVHEQHGLPTRTLDSVDGSRRLDVLGDLRCVLRQLRHR